MALVQLEKTHTRLEHSRRCESEKSLFNTLNYQVSVRNVAEF